MIYKLAVLPELHPLREFIDNQLRKEVPSETNKHGFLCLVNYQSYKVHKEHINRLLPDPIILYIIKESIREGFYYVLVFLIHIPVVMFYDL